MVLAIKDEIDFFALGMLEIDSLALVMLVIGFFALVVSALRVLMLLALTIILKVVET
jgi:hypothetical protein